MNVPGLIVMNNVISEEEEKEIIKWLDEQEWSNALSRRTQHYGYQYNYKNTDLIKGEPFSGWISSLRDSLIKQNIMESIDQCIINEYTRDQSIGKHIDGKRGDRPNIFGPRIVSISLGGDTNFIFTDTINKNKVEIYAPRRCLVIMTGDSRYTWTHEIPKRIYINANGVNIKKPDNYRRLSLTFRQTL